MEQPAVLRSVDGRVAYLTLNRPEKLNAINDAIRDGLESALSDLDDDDDVRVVVIKGAGRAFSTGYDLANVPGTAGYGPGAGEQRPSISRDRERLRKSIERWMAIWNYRKPLIAQVSGHCLAGGGELAAMCDLIYCSEDANFGHPAGRAIGIPMTLAFWPMRIGMLKSKELLFTGDTIDGREAERIGMVNKCLPQAALEDHVRSVAQRIAMVPSDALALHKHVVNRWFEIQGIRTCAAEGAEFDSIFHEVPSALEFARIARSEGLKAALQWRDAAFSDQGLATT